MKKPCLEEKTGFKTDLSKINILLIALFLSCEVFPQENLFSKPVPINGFCQFKNFKVPSGLNSLLALNFNNDSYTDLALYNPAKKELVSLSGKANGNFNPPVNHFLQYSITNIQPLNELNRTLKSYAFISRANMRAGIYSFTSTGRAYLSSTVKFDSYPGNLSTADIDKNGTDELLVSGSSFNGLTVLYHNGSSLKMKKVTGSSNYSNAVFADLNNDGYPDIAAFNIIDYSLDFYYNNSKGKFSKVRSIPLSGQIHNLKAVDMNLDDYIDLLFTVGNSIKIIYGDFASNYSKTVTLKTKYYPDKVITGDFNRDGKIDIAYINRDEGTLSLIYGKSDYTFFPEIIYHKEAGIENIIPFYSKFITGIAFIDTAGFVNTITSLPSFAENLDITIGACPTAINSFNYGNNGIADICFIDSCTSTLNLLVRNNAGIPSFLYSYPIAENHSRIVVDDQLPFTKIFYCFTPGKRLIEILKADFNKNSADNISIYSPGNISDLRIKNTGASFDNVYVSYIKDQYAGFCMMEYRDYRYSISDYPSLAANILCTNVTLYNNTGITYWQKTNTGAELNRVSFSAGETIKNKLFNLSSDKISSISSFTGDLLNVDRDITLSFINSKNKLSSVASDYKSTFLIKSLKFPASADIDAQSIFYFGKPRPNGLKKLYVYVPDEESVYRIDFIFRGRNILLSKIIQAENVGSFFIDKMSFRSFNLVYTDKLSNCISVRRL